MVCKDRSSCFSEIDAYCSGEKTGHVLLVNTQNYDIYQNILERLRADKSKNCVFVSDHCAGDGLPNLDDICSLVKGEGCYVLVGISQAAMLRGSDAVHDTIDNLLELPIKGYAVVLLDHTASYIKECMAKSKKVAPKVVLVEGDESPLLRIRLSGSIADCVVTGALSGMKELFSYMERITDQQVRQTPEVTVISHFSPAPFAGAVYSVTPCDKVYTSIARKYSDIATGTKEDYGTDEQWRELASLLEKYGSLSAVSSGEFGDVSDFSLTVGKVLGADDSFRAWLLWLTMKVFGVEKCFYLSYVIKNSVSVTDLEEHIYKDLLEIDVHDPKFNQYYEERKNIINDLPENLPLVDSYCSMVGRREKEGVYYLTDTSDKEKYELMRCLAIYDYSDEELLHITQHHFKSLYLYLQPFRFTSANTKLSEKDTALRDEFTEYFRKYKVQKVVNRIDSDFLSKVEEYSHSRPYNKLQARSTIVNNLSSDTKTDAQLFFFDALGVEYLSYIEAKCKEYNMVMELSIGRSALPSITVNNKEFIRFFKKDCRKIEELDDLKHHSQVIDYTKCKLPVHLFIELSIIDKLLREIQSSLVQGEYKSAVVIADHGASRLAVIREEENSAPIQLDEKAEHSGRCCPAVEDPHIPCAEFEGGFVILANYSRFKGGRKASVEVHGGATLEEVLVPVITISRKPEKQEVCFVNPLIELHGREIAAITLFSNKPLKQPRLSVNGKFYTGTFRGDKRHARFEMPELRRSRDCVADVYDGDAQIASGLPFRVQKSVAKDILQL